MCPAFIKGGPGFINVDTVGTGFGIVGTGFMKVGPGFMGFALYGTGGLFAIIFTLDPSLGVQVSFTREYSWVRKRRFFVYYLTY